MGTEDFNADHFAWLGLVEAIANGAYAFVGAGTSAALGYPTWSALLNHLHDTCTKEGIEPDRLEIIKKAKALVRAHMYEQELSRPRVLAEIGNLYGFRGQKTSPLHDALVAIGFDHYLTTNYDLLIESAHESAKINTRSLELKESAVLKFLRATHTRRGIEKTVLHIHGKVDRLDSVVLALNEYREVYGENTATRTVLENLLLTKSFVFIGYSLSDPPLNAILDRVKSLNRGDDAPQHWAIMPRPENAETVRAELKHEFNIEPIFYDNLDRKHSQLLPLVETLAKSVADFRAKNGQLVAANVIDAVFGNEGNPLTLQQAKERAKFIPTPSYLGALSTGAGVDTKSLWDYRIDAQVEVMKQGFYEQAKLKFEDLLKELPAEAEPRLRYRLHANIGHALLQLDRRAEVIPHYEAAFKNAPEKSDAKWMRALVAEFQGDYEEAVARAEALCSDDPQYTRGHTVRLRCSPTDILLIDLKRSISRTIRRDAEVAAALAEAADSRRDWRAQEAYARHVAKAAPEWEHAYNLLGASIMKRELGGSLPNVDFRVVPFDQQRIEEAHEWFTKAIGIMSDRPPQPHLATAYVNRAGTRRLLSDNNGAHEDCKKAYSILPDDLMVLSKYAHSLEHLSEFDKAIEVIEASPRAMDYLPARFMWLFAVLRGKKTGYLDLALPKAIQLTQTATLDPIEAADAHSVLCNIYLEQKRPEKAIEHLRSLTSSIMPPGLRDARLAAYLYRFASKDSEEAVTRLSAAIVEARSTAPWFARREIAQICAMLGRHRDAADIMATIISPKLFSEETDEYFDSLIRSKQYAAVREYCRLLRSNSQYTQKAMHAECDALYFAGETKEAIDLLTDWLAWYPGDKRARLHRSGLFVMRGEADKADFDPQVLPSIDDIQRPYDGIQVVHVLRHGPDFDAATEFAHQMSQKFPDNEEVQHTLITTLMLAKKAENPTSDSNVIGMRHTITLKAMTGDEKRTIKLSNSPSRRPDEFASTHEVAKNLVGKQVGDIVTLGTDEMVVTSVIPTALLAAHKAMQSFHLHFPNSNLIRKFAAPAQIANPKSIRDVLGEEWWQMATADDEATAEAFKLYQSGLMPLTLTARSLGRTVFETSLYVINSQEMDVVATPETANGNPVPFINSCLQSIRQAKIVVIDSTALATMFAFDMAHLLEKLPFEFIVPDSALQEVRRAKYDAEHGQSGHRAGLKDGNFFMTEVSPESMKAWAERLAKFIDVVQGACKIVGGSAREKLHVENKELLEENLGKSAFDAIAIAAESGGVLWTDDQMFGGIAHDLCRVSPIWSQAILHVADEKSSLKTHWRSHYLPEFLLFRFRGTITFIYDIAFSFKRFNWCFDDRMLRGVRDLVQQHGLQPRNYDSTRLVFGVMWYLAEAREFAKVSRTIWKTMNLFERTAAKNEIARSIYKPSASPLRRMLKSYSRFKNTFRLWACYPERVDAMLKHN